jgi:hypothetical protein
MRSTARAISVALLFTASLVLGACELPLPVVPPAPPAAPAPEALLGLSVYVHQLRQPVENDDDRYDYSHMPGFTDELRTAVGVALAQAGYKVAVDRNTPADLTALVYERWESSYREDERSPDGVATLALRSAGGVIVDRFSVPVGTVGTGYRSTLLQAHAASALVTTMGRSEPLVQFAATLPRRGGLAVAAAPAEAPQEAPAPLPMTYADALKDAADARPEEVSTALVAIVPSTPGLKWRDDGGKKRVLWVTWTSYEGYDDQVGKSLPLGRETWVTAAPFVADFCKGKGGSAAALSARLEQLLGLPPNGGKDRFVELWAEPKSVFRPCPDPEITDRECGLDFPQPSALVIVSPAHVKWFEDLRSRSYGEGGYPWTRLGYTFDWAGPKVGMSEFVIQKGAAVTVERVAQNEDYCR